MSKLNVKLLNRIKKHLIAEPKRYYQGTWGDEVSGKNAPACGTQGCIAGWAVFLSVPKSTWKLWMEDTWSGGERDIRDKAEKLLGLTVYESAQLFSDMNQTYLKGKRGVQQACKKIDELIESRKP